MEETTKLNQFKKHPLCKHQKPCVYSCALGFVRGAATGLTIRLILSLLGIIIKLDFKGYYKLIQILSPTNLRLPLFLSLLVGIHRTSLCIFRRITNNELASTFIANILSGISLVVEEPETRINWALFTLVRGIESLVKTQVARGRIPEIPYFVEIMYAIIVLPLHYGMWFESDVANAQYIRQAQTIACLGNGEYILKDFMHSQTRRRLNLIQQDFNAEL